MYSNGRVVAVPDLPYPISDASLTVYKDTIRLCGGYVTASRTSKDCLQLSISNNLLKMEKNGELPRGMWGHSCAQVFDDMWVFHDNYIYVVPRAGNVTVIPWPHGTFPRYSCAQTNGVSTVVMPDKSRDVYINLDATSPQSYVKLDTLPTNLERRSCLMMDSLFYVTGGRPGGKTSSWYGPSSKETYVIDFEKEGSVTRLANLLTSRGGHAMGVIDGSPAVFGGREGDRYFGGTEIFDTKEKKWRASVVKMVVPSADITSVSFAVNEQIHDFR